MVDVFVYAVWPSGIILYFDPGPGTAKPAPEPHLCMKEGQDGGQGWRSTSCPSSVAVCIGLRDTQ